MANPLPPATRRFLRRFALVLVPIYAVSVAAPAALKAGTGADAPPWAEVVYGPAITMGSCLLLVNIAVWCECPMGRNA